MNILELVNPYQVFDEYLEVSQVSLRPFPSLLQITDVPKRVLGALDVLFD